jgi:hypothetical protein
MNLAIADPPYPPFIGAGGRKNRASRWYGSNQRSVKDVIADQHPEADEWDDPTRHRQLLLELQNSFDGWAIATSPDGIAAYGPLPPCCPNHGVGETQRPAWCSSPEICMGTGDLDASPRTPKQPRRHRRYPGRPDMQRTPKRFQG